MVSSSSLSEKFLIRIADLDEKIQDKWADALCHVMQLDSVNATNQSIRSINNSIADNNSSNTTPRLNNKIRTKSVVSNLQDSMNTSSINNISNNISNISNVPPLILQSTPKFKNASGRTSIISSVLFNKDPSKLLDEIDSLSTKNKNLEEEKNKLLQKITELETDKKKLDDQVTKLNEVITIKTMQINESLAENVSLQKGNAIKKNITELTESIQQISD